MAEFQSPFVAGLPRFTGGAVGFIGYDASPIFEPVLADAWARASWNGSAPGSGEDDAGFMLFDTVLAFDHVKHRILIISNARITADEDLRALYQFACAKIQFLERELERGLSQPEPETAGRQRRCDRTSRAETFEAGVRAIKERIAAGDIYQAVLSQRFETDVNADPFTVYRALRHVNPSPYMYFIRMGGARDRRLVSRDAGPRRRTAGRDASDRRHAAARQRAKRRTCGLARS